jgi:hypothetical protein
MQGGKRNQSVNQVRERSWEADPERKWRRSSRSATLVVASQGAHDEGIPDP